ncbi:MAG: DUF4062 domain-containing protein [Victivallaceae bacterium]
MNKKQIIMVSSTIYGIEELLERIYTLLTGFGYEVWMSHKGAMPVYSTNSAFDNCLKAVEQCDLFLGLITTSYGSGQNPADRKGLSITHQEIIKAIELNKPRWILAHDHVVFARSLLTSLGYKGKAGRKKLILAENKVFNDLRILDLYEDATIDHRKVLAERKGNWVQKFRSPENSAIFITAQFSRYHEVEAFIRENFENSVLQDGGES